MPSKSITKLILISALVLAACTAEEKADNVSQTAELSQSERSIDIGLSYEKFTLDNGLRVIVREDRKAPIVNVMMVYEVGSKDEPAGKTGFAHLFEHLMFDGSENSNVDSFVTIKEMGGGQMNGSTSYDYTNYYATVPTGSLEQLLFLESDRMGHLLNAITQEKLDTQIGVVKNEKRVGEDRPLGSRVYYNIAENIYPVGHPYHHSVIGSMDDLSNASLDDVKRWFKTYYGAANAYIMLSGDINAIEARTLVEKYFGHIPAGPPLIKKEVDSMPLTENKFGVFHDRIDLPDIRRAYIAPRAGTADEQYFKLASTVLANGPTSRLHKKLVEDLKIANRIRASYDKSILSGLITLSYQPKSAADIDEINRLIDEEISRLRTTPPTLEEIEIARTAEIAYIMKPLDSVLSQSSILATGELYADSPGFYVDEGMELIASATPEDVRAIADKVFSSGYYELKVLPFPKYSVAEPGYDRSQGLPPRDEFSGTFFPELEQTTLKNGLQVVVARRPDAPMVEMAFWFRGGKSTSVLPLNGRDTAKAGIGDFAMQMLERGTQKYTAEEIANRKALLGSNIRANTDKDDAAITFSALNHKFEESLDLLAELVQNPTFPETEVAKFRDRRIALLRQWGSSPSDIAWRALNHALYGEGHPYAEFSSAENAISAVEMVERSDLLDWHKTWMRPNNAALLIVGDVDMEEIAARLEELFGDWKNVSEQRPEIKFSDFQSPQNKSRVIVIDKPGMQQSYVMAGRVVDDKDTNLNATAVKALNYTFGGNFASRINSNLREDKGWSYGVRSSHRGLLGPQTFTIRAPVQADRTGDSIAELLKEMRLINTSQPFSNEDLEKAVTNVVGSQGSRFETSNAVLYSMLGNIGLNRPLDYGVKEGERHLGLTVESVQSITDQVILTNDLTWVIVGDWSKIEDQVRAQNLGSIEMRSYKE